MRLVSGRATTRWFAILALDAGLTAASFWLAVALRFEGQLIEPYATTLPAMAALLMAFRLLATVLFRLHRWSFRLSGLLDGARLCMATVFGTACFLAAAFLIRDSSPPRSVVALELLLTTALMAAVRFSPRLTGLYVADWSRQRRTGALRTLIVGAGAAGEMLLRDIKRTHADDYHVVGFIDDDPAKWNLIVGGTTVLGSIAELRGLAADYQVDQILIAIPRLPARRIREILSLCADLKLRFKILPGSLLAPRGRALATAVQDLSPDDLLPRDPVEFARFPEASHLAQRTALVTGAAGSLGSEICAQLLGRGLGHLAMVDLNENGLYLQARRFAREYPQARISIEIGDVRDAGRIEGLFARLRPHEVFHAAAHKHVPLLEQAPAEAIKNNVGGTRHVAEAAHRWGAERFVYLSTDKAVRPSSVMGASKRLGEELVRELSRRSSTRFCAVRFGNVLGSAGSVVPLFREQIAAGGPVEVTHPEVRRYFMTISEAVALVLQTAYGDYGELCVLDMGEQILIADLARHMITLAGLVPEIDIPIVFTGLRPGEKLFEELFTEDEERTRRVDRRILVADCAPPPAGLAERVDDLLAAAAREDTKLVTRLLRELVPSYVPAEPSAAADEPPLVLTSGGLHFDVQPAPAARSVE